MTMTTWSAVIGRHAAGRQGHWPTWQSEAEALQRVAVDEMLGVAQCDHDVSGVVRVIGHENQVIGSEAERKYSLMTK